MSEQQYIERYWRNAKPEDAIKDPPMVARFKYEECGKWKIELLLGFDRDGSEIIWLSQSNRVKYCQVYDAPDPGEGWRLIDPRKEPLRVGDEFIFHLDRQLGWLLIDSLPTNWLQKNFYRRRIEQPKPKYEPFKWEDREQLRGRWVQCVDIPDNEWMITSMYIDESGLRANSVPANRLLTGFVFLDTGEPVGRRVE